MVGQGLGVVTPAQTPLGAAEDQQERPGSALEESELRPAYVDKCFMYTCQHGVFLLVWLLRYRLSSPHEMSRDVPGRTWLVERTAIASRTYPLVWWGAAPGPRKRSQRATAKRHRVIVCEAHWRRTLMLGTITAILRWNRASLSCVAPGHWRAWAIVCSITDQCLPIVAS
jgi:hypothetical protein